MPNPNADPGQQIPRSIIVHAVAGLSLAALLGYVLLAFYGETPPESLANLAIGGMGILGGMAMPQEG